MHFIGIDIGTSSIGSIAYDTISKKTESINRANKTSIESTHVWEKLQDPEKILMLVEEIILDFSERYSTISGIGITGQMHGMVYIDEKGNAVSPLYTWQDGRANQLYKENKSYSEYLSDETGYSLATGFGLVTHYYNLVNNLVPANAQKLCTVMDYVVMKLSGRKMPLTDHSNGASLGFFDLENLRFDTASLIRVGIDPSILPNIDQSATLAGLYRDTIPIYSAIGDNQAAFLGSVHNINNSIHITVGTSSQISIYSKEFLKISSLETRPFPGGGYILVGAALCGGEAFAILKNFFESTLQFFQQDEDKNIDIYKSMTSIPNTTNFQDIPYVATLFNGTRHDPQKRGSISNISASNLTPENLIVGFLKGISQELYDFYSLIPDNMKSEKDRIVGSGNGLKTNTLLQKIVKNQFHRKIENSQHHEEAAFGACLCAVVGSGYRKGFLTSSIE